MSYLKGSASEPSRLKRCHPLTCNRLTTAGWPIHKEHTDRRKLSRPERRETLIHWDVAFPLPVHLVHPRGTDLPRRAGHRPRDGPPGRRGPLTFYSTGLIVVFLGDAS